MLRICIIFLFFTSLILAQDAKHYSIMLETETDFSGKTPTINISWQNDSLASKYIVSKRLYNIGEFKEIATVSGGANKYSDLNIQNGSIYEYKVEKQFFYDDETITTNAYKCHSYYGTNIDEIVKTLLILVDASLLNKISEKLDSYRQILATEGWNVIIKNSPRVENFNPKAVISVKNTISSIFIQDSNLKSVLILGRVAVPYSGNIAPDGHGDSDPNPHKGAYPTDAYYADIDSKFWTDTSETNVQSNFDRQHNILNDGKWDQSFIPGEVELSIGRVDFYNMSFFGDDEAELINKYLQKNIDYRNGALAADNRAILQDGLAGWNRGFAADGWNNLTALYSRDGVKEMSVYQEIRENSYEMLYACAQGAFDNIYKGIYASDIAEDGYYSIHSIIFGSYNCDWDTPNNLLRATIASQPMGLTAVWGTRPFWNYFKLGIGETFGDALLSTQNNRSEYKYPSVAYNGGVHIALIGDPTLKLINEDIIENISVSYENNKPKLLGFRLIENKEIFGYQLMMINTTSKKYEIVETNYFEQQKSGEFNIEWSEAIDLLEYNLESAIVIPIYLDRNLSGTLFYTGKGKYIFD